MTLESFRSPRAQCWTCQLPPPILNEIDDTRRRLPGVGATSVLRWLVAEHGYEESEVEVTSIANHFQRRHHTKKRA